MSEHTLLVCGLALASACYGPDAPLVPPTRCIALEGKTFKSVTKRECGLGGHGVALCNWTLTFKAAQSESKETQSESTNFTFDFSDERTGGSVQCDGAKIIEGVVRTGKVRGAYDASKKQIVWDGVTYQLER